MTRKASRLILLSKAEESVGSAFGKRWRSRRFDIGISLTSWLSMIGGRRNRRLVQDRSQLCWGWSTMPKRTTGLDWLVKQAPSRTRKFRGRRDDRLENSMPPRRFAGHTRGSNLETSLNPWSCLEGCFEGKSRRLYPNQSPPRLRLLSRESNG